MRNTAGLLGVTPGRPARPNSAVAVQHRQNNFDITRLCMATFVFLGHYIWIFPSGPLPAAPVIFLIGEGGQRCVQAFFVISGFLMFQSFERSGNVLSFYEKRIRRIVPAYVTVICSSALIGLWLTHLSFRDYLSSGLVKYIFWNLLFLNFVQPTLPGVFDSLPVHDVNGPLWTLKIEVSYYILMPILFRFGRRIGFATLFLTLYVLSIIYQVYMANLASRSGAHIYSILQAQLPGQLCYFVAGAMVAAWRTGRFSSDGGKASYWKMLGGAALVAAGALYAGMALLYPALLAVLILTFCLAGPKVGGWMKYGDWSYGIYIIHFPVLQTLRSVDILGDAPYLRLLLASVAVFVLSAIMWHLIESPALKGRWVKKRAPSDGPRTAAVDL